MSVLKKALLIDVRAFLADVAVKRSVAIFRHFTPAKDRYLDLTQIIPPNNSIVTINVLSGNTLTLIRSEIPLDITITIGVIDTVFVASTTLLLTTPIAGLKLRNTSFGTTDPLDAEVRILHC